MLNFFMLSYIAAYMYILIYSIWEAYTTTHGNNCLEGNKINAFALT